MFKKTLVSLLLAGASFSSAANWVGSVGFINVSDADISLTGYAGSLGYKLNSDEYLHIVPEVRLGVGIFTDSVDIYDVDVEIDMDTFAAFSLRGQYDFNDSFYIFAAPSYANLAITASASANGVSYSETTDSWEFGIGGGAGFILNDLVSFELNFEQFDGSDVMTFSARFDL